MTILLVCFRYLAPNHTIILAGGGNTTSSSEELCGAMNGTGYPQ